MVRKELQPVFAAGLMVFVLTLVVFLPVLWGEFLNWDDNVLFLENPHFRGFGIEQLQWMCTTVFYGHWQPVSWFSYALDYLVWGLNPSGWHAVNWILHSINAVLVFLLCRRFQQDTKSSGALLAPVLAALLYAIHPLRVEPVAWLSTRGYLLGTTFCLLTVLSYLREVQEKRYPLLALFFFIFAALTKGISMMIPLVLLFVDWFPLQRMPSIKRAFFCAVEKAPFLMLSLLTGGMAFWAKSSAGGMASIEHHGISERIVQAVYGFWFYVLKGVSPQQLSPLYYKRPDLQAMVMSFVLTTLVAVLLFCLRRKAKAVFVSMGSSFLLIFPMIGITQSGSQLFADRFTYLASVPISVLLCAGLDRLTRCRRLVVGSVFVLLFVYAMQSVVWSGVWQTNLSLWESALAVDPKNPQAWNSSGLGFKERGHYQKAREYFNRAILIHPGYVQAWHNRAICSALLGENEMAYASWRTALMLPGSSSRDRLIIYWTRGWTMEQGGDVNGALNNYEMAINELGISKENRAAVLLLRAKLLLKQGDQAGAFSDLREILSLPDAFGTRHNEARLLLDQ